MKTLGILVLSLVATTASAKDMKICPSNDPLRWTTIMNEQNDEVAQLAHFINETLDLKGDDEACMHIAHDGRYVGIPASEKIPQMHVSVATGNITFYLSSHSILKGYLHEVREPTLTSTHICTFFYDGEVQLPKQCRSFITSSVMDTPVDNEISFLDASIPFALITKAFAQAQAISKAARYLNSTQNSDFNQKAAIQALKGLVQ